MVMAAIYQLRFIKANQNQKQMEQDKLGEQPLMNYMRQRVMPILEPLQFDVMSHRPTDIHDFAYLWLQNFKQGNTKINEPSSQEEEPDQVFMERLKKKGRRYKRKGISGEVYSTTKGVEPKSAQRYDKCEEDKIKILIRLKNFIFFKNISENNIEEIISRMKTRDYLPGEVVLREGEVGNELFLVDSGIFKCEISSQKQQVKIYEEGEAFGELALLYNTKRASTITAVSTGRLFSLDRISFNCILRDSVLKKTRLCEEILNKNQLFDSLKTYEKCKLIENIKEMPIGAGRYIIREGQLGDRFFIVAQGKLVAENMQDNGDIKPVYYYKEGDYFGEISLIRNVPRQASVKTLTSSKLLYIERSTFKRLLGPLVQILKRNQQRYRSLKVSVRNKIH